MTRNGYNHEHHIFLFSCSCYASISGIGVSGQGSTMMSTYLQTLPLFGVAPMAMKSHSGKKGIIPSIYS